MVSFLFVDFRLPSGFRPPLTFCGIVEASNDRMGRIVWRRRWWGVGKSGGMANGAVMGRFLWHPQSRPSPGKGVLDII